MTNSPIGGSGLWRCAAGAVCSERAAHVDRPPPVGANINSSAEFLRLIQLNPAVVELVHRAGTLGLPDTWVVSGCLFQTVWNVLAGEDPARAIKDYDLFYFDPTDRSEESEARANRRAAGLFADLRCEIDVRNQARVHLWYAKEFGVEGYPRLRRSTDGIDNFLAVCCMVAVRGTSGGHMELYAPFGVDDVLERVMRPNPWYPNAPRDCYNMKADRWRALWPALKIEPLPSSAQV
jgi:hypothetical protein